MAVETEGSQVARQRSALLPFFDSARLEKSIKAATFLEQIVQFTDYNLLITIY